VHSDVFLKTLHACKAVTALFKAHLNGISSKSMYKTSFMADIHRPHCGRAENTVDYLFVHNRGRLFLYKMTFDKSLVHTDAAHCGAVRRRNAAQMATHPV